MREWLLKAMAAICASAPLLVLLLMSLVMAGTGVSAPHAANDEPVAEKHAPPAAREISIPDIPDTLTRWLEQAASAYQSDVAAKLSVPRYAMAAAPEVQEMPAARDALGSAVDAALAYITYWIGQAYRMAGYAPSNFAHSAVALVADQTARDARAFVEARKKAEVDWNDAVERANAAAAEAARQESERKSAAERDAAEAERRRAEARKEELRKIKEDLDRRIEDGLKKLEELEKLDTTKRTEATRKALVADVARGAAETLKAVAEARRVSNEKKAAAEKQMIESKAEYAREVAEAEKARKIAEADRAGKAEAARAAANAKAAEEARRVAEEKKVAEAKDEEASKAAEAEAVRKASEARRAPRPASRRDGGHRRRQGRLRPPDCRGRSGTQDRRSRARRQGRRGAESGKRRQGRR